MPICFSCSFYVECTSVTNAFVCKKPNIVLFEVKRSDDPVSETGLNWMMAVPAKNFQTKFSETAGISLPTR